MDYYLIYYGIGLVSLLITLGASAFVKSSYSKYSKVRSTKNIAGSEVARTILNKHGLKDVYVVETSGNLTDHYDPSRKVVRLSTDIYNKETVASIAVAAHECGHAMQDKDNYTFMRIRSSIIPLVNISTKAGYIILFIGIFAQSLNLIWTGIILETAMLLFQLITLPVEFDASNRALKELESLNILNTTELTQAKTMLTAAALTYVASVATAVLQILRLILLYGRNNRR